ncbi:MAG TPA: phosphate acyltransferase [Thermoanaerobaculia bacterium]
MKAYGLKRLHFGAEYLIPKRFDSRVLIWEAAAVAGAAMASGVAQVPIDLAEYKLALERRLGKSREVMRMMITRAKRRPRRVVFPEGAHEKVLRASQIILDEGFAQPVLLGEQAAIRRSAADLGLHLGDVEVVDPAASDELGSYVLELHELRRRKGVTLTEARAQALNPTVFGALMVRRGAADALVAGVGQHYPETLRPALQIIGMREGISRVAGLFMLILRDRLYFFADPTVNIEPTAEEMAEIALLSAEEARRFHVEPRVAMISFSNFGSVKHPYADKVREATRIVRRRSPELEVDGEMQAGTAVTPELVAELFPFSNLKARANVLVFPDLQSANAAYQLVHRLAGAEAIGPILMGMKKPVHLLQPGSEVKDVVNMTAIAVVDALEAEDKAAVVEMLAEPIGRELAVAAV